MEGESKDKELDCIAGAYGPVESVPLLGDVIGHDLLDMVVIACSKLGFPSGIFQNDGMFFPWKAPARIQFFKEYCQAIRSTDEGGKRCRACDSQAVMNFTGGNNAPLKPELEKLIDEFPVQKVSQFQFEEEELYCYICHAGLLELVRAISLDFGDGSGTPIGAIWAGQNKVKGYTFSDDEVRKLAKEIDHPYPEALLAHYRDIGFTGKEAFAERAKRLAETARSIEDSASASFHKKKEARFDKISNAVFTSLRKSLSRIQAIAAKSVQDHINSTMESALKEIASKVPNCYSAVCQMPPNPIGTPDSKIQVQVLAHAGLHTTKLKKSYLLNVKHTELNEVLRQLPSDGDLKQFAMGNLDFKFFTKLKAATGLKNITYTIVAYIPTQQDHNKLLWVTLLCENCDVLSPRGRPLPDFLKMLAGISRNMSPVIDMAYFLARQRDAVQTLRKQKQELEDSGKQIELLIRNLAHQVSRPIMELKQAAYILARKGFSPGAYDNFRACLAEMERGARNFDTYEQLKRGFGGEEYGLHVCHSFDIKKSVEKAYNRIRPYLTVQRRELYFEKDLKYLSNIPNVRGNSEAFLECLVNVFHNAIKYSIGSRPVEVSLAYSQNSAQVEVRVTNYGVEIPESEWEKIFEEAYRADTAKQVAIEGSGTGLYISRKLIEIHEGEISVESSERAKPTKDGLGRWRTTFLLSLKCEEGRLN